MKHRMIFVLSFIAFYCSSSKSVFSQFSSQNFLYYIVDAKEKDLKLYWKDDKQKMFKNIENLKLYLTKNNKKLLFAMNGGMTETTNSPTGLFIENGNIITPLNESTGASKVLNCKQKNFYMKPNGVFYIKTDYTPLICTTSNFKYDKTINYATQSGPMLLIEGEIHPCFRKNSKNLYRRNGVGILPDNKVIFIISKGEVNFYDFASYFKSTGCKNALYLDGAVSDIYLPEKHIMSKKDKKFSVIIGVSSVNDK